MGYFIYSRLLINLSAHPAILHCPCYAACSHAFAGKSTLVERVGGFGNGLLHSVDYLDITFPPTPQSSIVRVTQINLYEKRRRGSCNLRTLATTQAPLRRKDIFCADASSIVRVTHSLTTSLTKAHPLRRATVKHCAIGALRQHRAKRRANSLRRSATRKLGHA